MRIAIFGGGRVGTAMAAEMLGVPVVRRGGDLACDVACVCWPAHAIANFRFHHPLASRATRVAFCNGVWAVDEGADHAGICYVRAAVSGDRAPAGRKAWRVGDAAVARALRAVGLGVVESRGDHIGHLWGKALYLLPIALACADTGTAAGPAIATPAYAEWYDAVRCAGVAAVGADTVRHHEPRVRYLVERTPRSWTPSPSADELAYFRERLLCAGS